MCIIEFFLDLVIIVKDIIDNFLARQAMRHLSILINVCIEYLLQKFPHFNQFNYPVMLFDVKELLLF